MKKQHTDRTLYSEELEQLNFGETEQEVHELFERENLPTASELEKYDALMPNGAERVFNLIEDERIRRYDIELKRLGGRNRLNQLISASGLVLGILLFITLNTPSNVDVGYLSIWAIIVIVLILAPFIKSSLSNKN